MTTEVREVPAKTDPAIPGPPRGVIRIDVTSLRRRLRSEVSGEVRFDRATLAMYANDASNFRQVPIGVVIPKTLDDVVAAHRVCREFGAPVLNRGGGTSLFGETVNYAVVIDHSKYLTGVGEIDPERRLVTCEPGVINEELNRQTGKHGLVFGPDPSSHSRCVIGGNIGNNSCGIHSVQSQLYGPGPRTSDNVHALEIVTYDGARFWVGNGEEDRLEEIIAAGGRKGQIYAALRDLRDRYADQIRARYPSVAEVPRRVSGYNLDELLPEKGFNVARALTGTESTCATVLRATLMLTPALQERTTVVVGYPELADAGDHCAEIIERWRPIGLEALDEELIDEQEQQDKNASDIEELPRGAGSRAWLLVQVGADTAEESEGTARRFADWLTGQKGYAADRIVIAESRQEGGWSEDLWTIREGGLGATAFARGEDNWPGWEDSAVPTAKIGSYVRATGGMEPEKKLLQQMGLAVWNLQGGCCGLAGSWGFEQGKYDISMDCGEQALLPAVREADADTLIVADGFSCKTQIADARTGRRALHTGQVLAMAGKREPGNGIPGPPERPAPSAGKRAARTAAVALPAVAGLAVATAVARKAARAAVKW